MKKLLTIFFVLILTININAQGIAFEKEDVKWENILAKAKQENKIIFIDAYTTWCGPCKWMANNIFPDKKVGEIFNAQFVNAKIDMEKGEGVDIAKKYNVRAYPTYLFVNGDGELVHRSLGGMPAEKFIEVAKAANDPNKQFLTLKKKFDAGQRAPEFLKNLSLAALESQDNKLATQVSIAYLETQKDWNTKENMDFVLKFSNSMKSPAFAYVMKNKEPFIKAFGAEAVEQQLEYTIMSELAGQAYNREKKSYDLEKAKTYAVQYLPADIVDKVVGDLKLREFGMKNDIPGMMAYALEHLEKYPTKNANMLNQYAWTFYEHNDDKMQLEKALSWSLKSIEINDNYAFNDTAAALYFKLGNKSKAKEFAEKAIKKAELSGEDATETKALLTKVEAMN
jgi:thioredoxin-related protein